jgi:hypothetical protein
LPPKQNRPVLIKKFYSQDKNQEIYGWNFKFSKKQNEKLENAQHILF